MSDLGGGEEEIIGPEAYGEDPIETFAEPDWYLRHLVSLVNDNVGDRIPVTVVVGGTVVAGDLAAVSDFFVGSGQTMSEYFADPETQTQIRREFDEMSMEHRLLTMPGDGDDGDSVDIGYLHMEDARVLVGERSMQLRWWRCRLASVDAWAFGSPL